MKTRLVFQIMVLGLITLIIVSVMTAFAAGIDIAPSNAGVRSIPVSAEDIKPPECSALYLANIVKGTGTIIGTSGNDLILGSSGIDIIDGGGGDDCIEGGGGADIIDGNTGEDVLMGGGGLDTCTGGIGSDIFYSCEVEIP